MASSFSLDMVKMRALERAEEMTACYLTKDTAACSLAVGCLVCVSVVVIGVNGGWRPLMFGRWGSWCAGARLRSG